MATKSLATSSSTVLKHSQVLPERDLLLHHHPRILPVRPVFPLVSSFRASASSPCFSPLIRVQSLLHSHSRRSSLLSCSPPPPAPPPPLQQRLGSSSSGRSQISVSRGGGAATEESGEEVFFDGGVHFGDLLVNLLFGFTLVWLPLTITAVFRNLFLRYRFTNLRATVQSGLLGGDRKDFSYDVVKDVKLVPRFIGEWGDIAIELKDGTNVEIRCVPKFREIAAYVQQRAAGKPSALSSSSPSSPPRGGGTPKKGFS